MKRILGIIVLSLFCAAAEPFYDFRQGESYQKLNAEDRAKLDQADRDLVLLWGALDMYAQGHDGDEPATLDALVPRYLKDLPKDPFATDQTANETELNGYVPSLAGRGFRYKAGVGDAFVICSVGLKDFPYLAEKGNVGLYRARGIWLSGKQLLTERSK